MKYQAGERIRILRELMDLSREEMAELSGIDSWVRIRNIENLQVKVSADDIEKITAVVPPLVMFLVAESPLEVQKLKESENVWCRLIAAKLEAQRFPSNTDMKGLFVD